MREKQRFRWRQSMSFGVSGFLPNKFWLISHLIALLHVCDTCADTKKTPKMFQVSSSSLLVRHEDSLIRVQLLGSHAIDKGKQSWAKPVSCKSCLSARCRCYHQALQLVLPNGLMTKNFYEPHRRQIIWRHQTYMKAEHSEMSHSVPLAVYLSLSHLLTIVFS